MNAVRRTVSAVAVSMAVGVTAACGGSGTRAHSAASHSAGPSKGNVSSVERRVQAAVLSQKQLGVVALSGTDIPLLKRAPEYDRTGVSSIRYEADEGGPECTTFLNAQFMSGPYYHGRQEVDRGYTLTTDSTVQLETMAVGYSSAREAERVIDDSRTSVKHCSALRYRLKSHSFSFKEVAGIPIPRTGDDSTAFRASWSLHGRKAESWATELVRVGTVVVSVNATSSPDPFGLLQQTGKQAAAQLRKEEVLAADTPSRGAS
jgi:hypothetical protein